MKAEVLPNTGFYVEGTMCFVSGMCSPKSLVAVLPHFIVPLFLFLTMLFLLINKWFMTLIHEGSHYVFSVSVNSQRDKNVFYIGIFINCNHIIYCVISPCNCDLVGRVFSSINMLPWSLCEMSKYMYSIFNGPESHKSSRSAKGTFPRNPGWTVEYSVCWLWFRFC